jgi:hypothetical protein
VKSCPKNGKRDIPTDKDGNAQRKQCCRGRYNKTVLNPGPHIKIFGLAEKHIRITGQRGILQDKPA